MVSTSSTLFVQDYCNNNNKFKNCNRLQQQQERHYHDEGDTAASSSSSFTFDIDNETTIRSTSTSSSTMMFFRQFVSSSSASAAAVLTAATTLLSLPPPPTLLPSVLGPPAPNTAASSSTFVVVSGFSPSSSLSLQFAPSRQILQQISRQPQQQQPQQQTTSSFAFFWGGGGTAGKIGSEQRGGSKNSQSLSAKKAYGSADSDEQPKKPVVRIGIIGGGIVGVSSAHALAERHKQLSNLNYDITILEAGMPPPPSSRPEADAATNSNQQQPIWKATAWNGNSIVPGASFSVLSQRSTLFGVLKDTAREMYQFKTHNDNIDETELFATVPPYFALHLYKCLVGTGPHTTNEERMSFVRFISQYLYYSIVKGGKEDASIRSHHIGTLAKSNRNIYEEVISNASSGKNISLADSIGNSKGFLSIHRSKEEAQATLQHVRSVGEEAHLVENWETACEIEPHLRNIPSIMQPLFVVRRPNDYTANCNAFTRYRVDSCSQNLGVRHVMANVKKIIQTTKKDEAGKNIFHVIAKDGNVYEFDILVLAAGINTPLLASQLNAAKYCPTYPLRGFSLTIYFPSKSKGSSKNGEEKQNLIRQPFKLDSMYCTSVSPTMARWVGFGEFAGYRTTADDVPSIAPSVLKRYAKMIFPEVANNSNDAAITETEAVACSRALSPDDLPVVGEVPTVDNLFLNSGHGSLGWSTGLATGEMLAQAVERKLQQQQSGQEGDEEGTMYKLSDGSQFDPKVYSPGRFA